ncbi:MAG: hypothetical protein IJG51_09070 [Synergistaceae bacterium]|nr:hypothetical protein [Synergistaceae bacterium]MBQ3399027.1 hypothetical protein [Synergistaceae bacterium]MBQ6418676.1 hypothetical protein [Synergistaceae bacterium]
MDAVLNGSSTTVPFSAFEEGKARQIFAEVRRSGTKIVVNDDDSAECILMSPEEYLKMSDDYNDVRLMAVAEDRLSRFDPSCLIPAEEVYRTLGITQEELDAMPEVELE